MTLVSWKKSWNEFFFLQVFSGTWVSETRVLYIGTQVSKTQVFETQVPKSFHITNMFVKLT